MTMMMMLSNPICWSGYSKMHRLKQGQDIDILKLRLQNFAVVCFYPQKTKYKRLLTPHRW